MDITGFGTSPSVIQRKGTYLLYPAPRWKSQPDNLQPIDLYELNPPEIVDNMELTAACPKPGDMA